LSTRSSNCRGGTGLKTAFVSVCGNLQHIRQNIIKAFKVFLLPYTSAMMQNVIVIQIFGWPSVQIKKSLA
jgi:hypothetical protein